MVVQFRRYKIRSGRSSQFAHEWAALVAPLRQAHGFKVQGWLLTETDEFFWLLEHDDADRFEAADAEYYQSPQRRDFDPDPARLIERADKDWVARIL